MVLILKVIDSMGKPKDPILEDAPSSSLSIGNSLFAECISYNDLSLAQTPPDGKP